MCSTRLSTQMQPMGGCSSNPVFSTRSLLFRRIAQSMASAHVSDAKYSLTFLDRRRFVDSTTFCVAVESNIRALNISTCFGSLVLVTKPEKHSKSKASCADAVEKKAVLRACLRTASDCLNVKVNLLFLRTGLIECHNARLQEFGQRYFILRPCDKIGQGYALLGAQLSETFMKACHGPPPEPLCSYAQTGDAISYFVVIPGVNLLPSLRSPSALSSLLWSEAKHTFRNVPRGVLIYIPGGAVCPTIHKIQKVANRDGPAWSMETCSWDHGSETLKVHFAIGSVFFTSTRNHLDDLAMLERSLLPAKGVAIYRPPRPPSFVKQFHSVKHLCGVSIQLAPRRFYEDVLKVSSKGLLITNDLVCKYYLEYLEALLLVKISCRLDQQDCRRALLHLLLYPYEIVNEAGELVHINDSPAELSGFLKENETARLKWPVFL